MRILQVMWQATIWMWRFFNKLGTNMNIWTLAPCAFISLIQLANLWQTPGYNFLHCPVWIFIFGKVEVFRYFPVIVAVKIMGKLTKVVTSPLHESFTNVPVFAVALLTSSKATNAFSRISITNFLSQINSDTNDFAIFIFDAGEPSPRSLTTFQPFLGWFFGFSAS